MKHEGEYSLYDLEQARTVAGSLVGLSAVSLGELATEGHPVSPTAILPTTVLTAFLDQVDWQSPLLRDFPQLNLHLNVARPEPLQAISQAIQTNIKATTVPMDWLGNWLAALEPWGCDRIWLTPSLWLPDQHHDQLTAIEGIFTPQACWLNPSSLVNAVRDLWCQVYQAASLYQWASLNVSLEQVKLAVVMQPLQSTLASGWLHIHSDRLTIQATHGLPLSVLLGEASPDVYQFDVTTQVLQSQLGHKPYIYQVPPLTTPPPPCIIGTLQPLEQQQQYALPAPHLQHVIHLGQALMDAEPPKEWTLAWSLLPGEHPSPQVHILGVATHPPWPLPKAAVSAAPSTAAPSPLTPAAAQHSEFQCLAQGLAATPGQIIAPALVTQRLQAHPLEAIKGAILVIPMCQPDDLPWLQQAAGVICERGGLTSHGAILARELGLPAVVGYTGATATIQTGQLIGVDGEYGTVYQLGAPDPGAPLSHSRDHRRSVAAEAPEALPTTLKTQIWVTLSHAQALQQLVDLPVDGLGLLRGEWLMLTALHREHPQVWLEKGKQDQLTDRLVAHLHPFVDTFSPRPVFYRSLDGRSNELALLSGGEIWEEPEPNPMLGLRGTARYPAAAEIFDCELAALAQLCAQGYENIRLLLPFVRSVEEFQWCKTRIEAVGLSQTPGFQVWVMAEVPSMLFLLPEYVAAGVQGLAIGSNDFTQLILGVDREQHLLADYFDASHPAVIRAMAQLVQTATTLGIPCSICGQAPAQYPQLIPHLIEWGITAITVDLQTVAMTRRAIAQAEQQMLSSVLREHSPRLDVKIEDGLR